MAEKKRKKKRDAIYRKGVNAEFHKETGSAFTGGGSAAYQPRDSGSAKPGRGLDGKKEAKKSMRA